MKLSHYFSETLKLYHESYHKKLQNFLRNNVIVSRCNVTTLSRYNAILSVVFFPSMAATCFSQTRTNLNQPLWKHTVWAETPSCHLHTFIDTLVIFHPAEGKCSPVPRRGGGGGGGAGTLDPASRCFLMERFAFLNTILAPPTWRCHAKTNPSCATPKRDRASKIPLLPFL